MIVQLIFATLTCSLLIIQMTIVNVSAILYPDRWITEGKLVEMLTSDKSLAACLGNAFKRDRYCGALNTAGNRVDGCKTILNSPQYRQTYPNRVFDAGRTDAVKQKCVEYAVSFAYPELQRRESLTNVRMKMFCCPVTTTSGAVGQMLYVAATTDASSLIVFDDGVSGSKTPYAWYDPDMVGK